MVRYLSTLILIGSILILVATACSTILTDVNNSNQSIISQNITTPEQSTPLPSPSASLPIKSQSNAEIDSQQQTQTESPTCSDSDNGDINIKGTVNGELTDYCTGDILTEYYCDSNNSMLEEKNVSCQKNGKLCSDGACVNFNAKGSLTVTSDPSQAFVFLDTIARGRTPITISVIAMGKHSIMISKPGYLTYIKSFNATAGNNTLSFVLDKRPS